MSVAPLQLLKSEFNPLVYVALDNTTDKYVSIAYFYGTTGTTPSDAYFTKGALLVHATDGTLYQNTANDGDTPSWGIIGAGSGVAIGDAITDADAGSILYVDGTGNLAQDAFFTRTETETFIENVIDLGMGEILRSGFTSPAGIPRIGGSYVVSGTPQLSTEVVADPSEGEVNSLVNYTLTGISSGFRSKSRASTIGDIAGGNGTYITVDDLNEKITVANVPTYANDAAAITGGLTTGMLYKTTTGGITALNIVP